MSTINGFNSQQAQVAIGRANKEVGASVANLVSGKKEDANVADFSVGSVLRSKASVLKIATLNAGQGKNLLQTAKGAISTIVDILDQQKNLAAKASDDSLSDNERGFLNQEFQALTAEIDRISDNTDFNGKKLINGSISGEAGVASATGLSEENYSLINANQITTSGTVGSGDLTASHAVFGETTLNFGAVTTGAAVVFSIDSDGTGSTAAQTTTYTTEDGDTAAEHAARFVAAASADTDKNFTQFNFTDNGDGTVTVKAKEAGDYVNTYFFSSDITAGNATTGIGGTVGNIDNDTSLAFTTGTNTDGSNGIFKAVSANNIATSALSAEIEFGTDSSTGANSVNGTLGVQTITFDTTALDDDILTISVGGAFNDSVIEIQTAGEADEFDASTGTLSVVVNTDLQEQLEGIANALNDISDNDADGAASLFTFAATATTIVATQKTHTDTASDVTAVNNFNAVVTGTGNLNVTAVTETTTAVVGTDVAAQIILRDRDGTAVATTDVTISANTTTSNLTGALIASDVFADLDETTSEIARFITFVDNGDGTLSLTFNEDDLKYNEYSLEFDLDGGTGAATLGGTVQFGGAGNVDITTNGTGAAFDDASGATNVTLAATASVADADLTFDERLLGDISGLTGRFDFQNGNPNNNIVSFTAEVNGVTYSSQDIFLKGSTATSTTANTILAGTVLTFQSQTGEVDSNGAFTNNAFQLTFASDSSLADVTSAAAGQESLNTIVTSLQSQLDTISINQSRSLNVEQINPSSSDHRVTSTVGTILEGLRGFDSIGTDRTAYADGDIRLTSDIYGDTGTLGSITSFNVDRLNDTISTTINGDTFTAYLNTANAPTLGGVQAFGLDHDGTSNNGSYNATTKIITLGSSTLGESAKLNFYSESTDDGAYLTVDLGNVAANITQINISTTEGEDALAAALNAAFDVSESDSLSFQVGSLSSDSIGVSLSGAKTTDLYKDDDGASQTLSIATLSDAQEANDVLTNALNTAISLVADIDSTISRFDSAIQNNESSIQNADAARSVLLDTDYSTESTNFATARVKVDAASAILSQVNARIQNLLQLLQQ